MGISLRFCLRVLLAQIVCWCAFSLAFAEVDFAPGELLVRFKQVATATDIDAINKRIGCETIREIEFIEVYQLKIISRLSVKEAVKQYSQNQKVEFAEPNYRIELRQRVLNNAERWPDDPTFDPLAATYGYQWSLDNWGQILPIWDDAGNFPFVCKVDADIDAPQMWRMITDATSTIIVAILDTGIDWDHPDLAANIWSNPDEIAGNGIDDDDNNYIDDIRGWDFVDNDNDPDDQTGHGTHVAGIVGAEGNNLMGVTGICWSVELMPVRMMDGQEPWDFIADACLAIDYALHEGAKIINASWGFYHESASVGYAIERANDKGVLFVCAVGYGNNDIDLPGIDDYPPEYPAPNLIAVTASTHEDEKLNAANYGSISVDLAAPGECIYSTMPVGPVTMNFEDTNWCNYPSIIYYQNDWDFMTGTSMAAPHVSGVAALCWSLEPWLTHLELKEMLLDLPESFNAADKEKKPDFQQVVAHGTVTEGRLRAAQNADYGDAPVPPYPTHWPPIDSGAIHLDCGLEWLGDSIYYGTQDISIERSANDADGTDTDGIPNLIDNDFFDDGVRFFPPYFCKCWEPMDRADVTVVVSDPISGRYGGGWPGGDLLYLSAYFDFNGDGDWQDDFSCHGVPFSAPEHLLIQAVGGPGAFSVVNPLPDNFIAIDPSLWGPPATRQSRRIELYFYSPDRPYVADSIWTRFRLEYNDKEWPHPDNKWLNSEFSYSLFGEVEDYDIYNNFHGWHYGYDYPDTTWPYWEYPSVYYEPCQRTWFDVPWWWWCHEFPPYPRPFFFGIAIPDTLLNIGWTVDSVAFKNYAPAGGGTILATCTYDDTISAELNAQYDHGDGTIWHGYRLDDYILPETTMVLYYKLLRPDTSDFSFSGSFHFMAGDSIYGWSPSAYNNVTVELTHAIKCCDHPGDANDDGAVNILDITYLIAYLYQGGPPPPCMYEGDANADCTINILDITYLITYLYLYGFDPICADDCPDW